MCRHKGSGGRVCFPMTFPHAPHFHFWDERYMFVLMTFDILFIFIFQRNSTKPKDDGKDRPQHPGPGMGPQLLSSTLSGPNLKPFHPEEAGKSRRSQSCGCLAKGGLRCTQPQGPPLLAEVKLFLRLCWGSCQRNKHPTPSSVWSLAVTWAVLGYFCWGLVVLKGTVSSVHIARHRRQIDEKTDVMYLSSLNAVYPTYKTGQWTDVGNTLKQSMVISYEITSLLLKMGLLHNTEPHWFKCKWKAGVPKALSSVLVCYLRREQEERFEKTWLPGLCSMASTPFKCSLQALQV